jgi:hypothetical protein
MTKNIGKKKALCQNSKTVFFFIENQKYKIFV